MDWSVDLFIAAPSFLFLCTHASIMEEYGRNGLSTHTYDIYNSIRSYSSRYCTHICLWWWSFFFTQFQSKIESFSLNWKKPHSYVTVYPAHNRNVDSIELGFSSPRQDKMKIYKNSAAVVNPTPLKVDAAHYHLCRSCCISSAVREVVSFSKLNGGRMVARIVARVLWPPCRPSTAKKKKKNVDR